MRRYLGFVGCALLLTPFLFPQQNSQRQSSPALDGALVRLDSRGRSPVEIRFPQGKQVPVASFFEQYRPAFDWPAENEPRLLRASTDELGQTHHRFSQYYKGIELAEVQFLVHEKDGAVFLAHGKLIHGLDLDVTPRLSEQEALQYALHHVKADSYMWENPKNEALLKRDLHDPGATYFPKGELKLSAGNREPAAENFRLVYRLDIFAERPFCRNYVDVDANTGEVIKTISRLRTGDVQGWGQSLYNGMVPIVVSDGDYPTLPLPPSRWHLDTWNAYGGSGQSWWMANPALRGYDDSWCEALDTDPIALSGGNPTLTFCHRYAVEPPSSVGTCDGWDGMNVRISTDGGVTWSILANPSPAYTCAALYGFLNAEGDLIPGWAGTLENWTQVSFDLSPFSQKTVLLRFAFASDYGVSTRLKPELFGWQVDEITVTSSVGLLFRNNGLSTGVTANNVFKEVNIVSGNYRLRERARGSGIATYNALNQYHRGIAVDFVDEDSIFTDPEDLAGVSAYWGLEASYDYFFLQHGRRSFDDSGTRILSYANWFFFWPDGSIDPNNAAWGGACVYFGSGDGKNQGPQGTLDIAGHELAHGVTEFSAGLTYENEPGALNESFSDIFGTMVEFSKEGAKGDWLMGEDAAISGGGVRSLVSPKTSRNPDTYLGLYWVPPAPTPAWENDFGGVHTNCGVQNHWFYLLSEGGSGVNDKGDAYSVTGIGKEKAAQIAYRNLTVYLMPTSVYYDARWGSIHAAIDLFGANSPEVQSVISAWYAVGVLRSYVAPYPQNCVLSKSYLAPGKDTLRLRTELVNPETKMVQLQAIIESAGLAVSDTLSMYDDGLHQDSTAGDGIYGAAWGVRPGERTYAVHLKTTTLGTDYFDITHKAAMFTTVGPVVLEVLRVDRAVVRPGDRFQVMLTLGNKGQEAVAKQVSAKFQRLDTCCVVSAFSLDFGDILPRDTSARPVVRPLLISSTCRGGHNISVELQIFSAGILYWRDTFSVFVDTTLTGVDIAGEELPIEYSLSQNYPNPFNSISEIRYRLPAFAISERQAGISDIRYVRLAVYDLLGREVAVLVDERKAPGTYPVSFNASQLSSGVYIYRLTAGQYVASRKMVLTK